MANKTKSLADSIKELTDKVNPQSEKLKKEEKPLKGKNGGARPNSGRKPTEQTLLLRNLKGMVDEHIKEAVDVQIRDPKTGEVRTIKKPRLVAILEVLYVEGFNNKSVAAMKEWLDRALGKSPQPIKGDVNDDTPIHIVADVTDILSKEYDDQ